MVRIEDRAGDVAGRRQWRSSGLSRRGSQLPDSSGIFFPMRSAAAKAAEGRLMCLLILVPGRAVIGSKRAESETV